MKIIKKIIECISAFICVCSSLAMITFIDSGNMISFLSSLFLVIFFGVVWVLIKDSYYY